jgi:hypothetical protein
VQRLLVRLLVRRLVRLLGLGDHGDSLSAMGCFVMDSRSAPWRIRVTPWLRDP